MFRVELYFGNFFLSLNLVAYTLHAVPLYQLNTRRRKKAKWPFVTPWARKQCDVYPDFSHVSDISVFLATRPLSHASRSEG